MPWMPAGAELRDEDEDEAAGPTYAPWFRLFQNAYDFSVSHMQTGRD